MKRLVYFAPLVVFVALLGVLAWFNFHKKAQYEPRELVGKPVPEVVINDLQDGNPASLKALAAASGKPVLVNMFASWCAPCIAESPQLAALRDKGVTIIGIAWKDDPKATLNFLAQHGNPYSQVLTDPDGRMALALGIQAVPETFVVAPDGTITDKISGPVVPDNFATVLAEVTK